MYNLTRLLLIVLLVVAPGLAQKKKPSPNSPPPPPPRGVLGDPVFTWEEHVSQESNFKVKFPGKPLLATQTIDSPLGKLPVRNTVLLQAGIRYNAIVTDYPIVIDELDEVQSGLDDVRNLTLSRGNGKLLSETKLTLAGYPEYEGREWKMMLSEGLMKARVYLVRHRLYLLAMVMPAEFDASAFETEARAKYFSSFQLLKEPKLASAGVRKLSEIMASLKDDEAGGRLDKLKHGWQKHESTRFGYRVELPSEPYTRLIQLNLQDTDADQEITLARNDQILCIMLVAGISNVGTDADFRKVMVRSVFEGLTEGLSLGFSKFGKPALEVIGQTSLPQAGGDGYEYVLRLGVENLVTRHGKARSWVAGKFTYMLFGMAISDAADPQEVGRFLDSFVMTKAPATVAASNRYVSTAGNFAVEFPALYSEGVLPKETASGTVELRFASAETPEANFVALHTSFPPNMASQFTSPEVVKLILESSLKGLRDTTGAELLEQKSITFQNFQGLEARLKMRTGQVTRERLVLIHNRMYQLRVLMPIGKPDPASAQKFFDSFTLLSKPEAPAVPPPPPPKPEPTNQPVLKEDLIPVGAVRVSNGVLQGTATKKVQPEYPPIAKAAGAQGIVHVQVSVAENGSVIDATVLEGHPLLRQAALTAAKQWLMKPVIVNGKAMKAVGILIFNFSLQ